MPTCSLQIIYPSKVFLMATDINSPLAFEVANYSIVVLPVQIIKSFVRSASPIVYLFHWITGKYLPMYNGIVKELLELSGLQNSAIIPP